jgi:hypothetical protein
MTFHNLSPSATYQVWLADLTTSGDTVTGCSALQAGTFTTGRTGLGSFNGSVAAPSGPRKLQVIVSDSNPFLTFSGYTTPPTALDVQ